MYILTIRGKSPEEIADYLDMLKEQIQEGYTSGTLLDGWDLSEED